VLLLYVLYGVNDFLSQDMLNYSYKKDVIAFGNVGGWSLSHFITFFIAGLLFPHQWMLVFILGVTWEFIESGLGDFIYTFVGNNNSNNQTNTMYSDQWLQGNLSDIWFNSIGLFLGYWTSIFLRNRGAFK
jgi:hypothetical protein